jgi:hypothetical protein
MSDEFVVSDDAVEMIRQRWVEFFKDPQKMDMHAGVDGPHYHDDDYECYTLDLEDNLLMAEAPQDIKSLLEIVDRLRQDLKDLEDQFDKEQEY